MSLAKNVTIKWEKYGYLFKKETLPVNNKEENSLTSDLVLVDFVGLLKMKLEHPTKI